MSETKFEEFKSAIELMKKDLESSLDGQIEVEKFISVLMAYIKNNPSRLDDDRQSLFNSIRDAASEGLLIDGRESYISPFKGKIKFSAMVGGFIKKLAIAGVYVNVQVVYKNDKFKYWTDELGPHINHEPDILNLSGLSRGEMIGVYCIFTTKDTKNIEIMSKDEVEGVRKKSSQPNSLMWTEFYNEGAKKSVVRRGYKWSAKNPKLESFFNKDDEDNFDFSNQEQEIKPARTTSRVEEIINNNKEIQQSKKEEVIDPNLKSVEGEIEGIKIKMEGKNQRFVCKIGEFIYGTDLKAMYEEAIIPLYERKTIIRVSFTERETSDMIMRDIIKIEIVKEKENIGEIKSPPKKEKPL